MMEEVASLTEISDPHKFTLRLIFFRYLPSDRRRALLEQRLQFLRENRESLTEMEEIPSRALDRYRRLLIGYHAKQNAEEIAFIESLLKEEDPVEEVCSTDNRRIAGA
ncbi:hypothetical protein D3C78_1287290 [compost metagenome]